MILIFSKIIREEFYTLTDGRQLVYKLFGRKEWDICFCVSKKRPAEISLAGLSASGRFISLRQTSVLLERMPVWVGIDIAWVLFEDEEIRNPKFSRDMSAIGDDETIFLCECLHAGGIPYRNACYQPVVTVIARYCSDAV